MSARVREAEPLLPPGWVKCFSSKHSRFYWFDTATGTSRWTPPPAEETPDLEEAKEPSAKRRRAESPLKAAVVVPYRDLHVAQKRAEHLARFAPHMKDFLGISEGSDHKVFIIEQSNDGKKFNRGKLLNAGFDVAAREGFDLFIFHDVDLLPHRALAPLYTKDPGKDPMHIAGLWGRYSDNPKYCGGIVVFTKEQFRTINGFPNFFWGWGGEDDEMYNRVVASGMKFVRPSRTDFPEGETMIEDLEGMDIHTKTDVLRQHKDWKCMIKRELLQEHESSWRRNGLSNLQYEVVERDDGFLDSCVKVTVELGLNGHDFSDYKARITKLD